MTVKRKTGEISEWSEQVEAEFLPRMNVMNIAKSVIPKTVPENLGSKTVFGKKIRTGIPVKLEKSFQDLLEVCVAEFIHIIAAKLWLGDSSIKRQIFTDEDILHAMEGLGIGQYSTILRLFMNDYRELVFDVLTKRLNKSLTPDVLLQLRDG
jgi:hypothetical protein